MHSRNFQQKVSAIEGANAATTNEGTDFWITCEASYSLLCCCYILIVRLQHIVLRKLNLQPRHKTSSNDYKVKAPGDPTVNASGVKEARNK